MFAPAFDIVGALLVVGTSVIAIGSWKYPAFPIKFHIKGIVASSFGEKLKNIGLRMVTPDRLP